MLWIRVIEEKLEISYKTLDDGTLQDIQDTIDKSLANPTKIDQELAEQLYSFDFSEKIDKILVDRTFLRDEIDLIFICNEKSLKKWNLVENAVVFNTKDLLDGFTFQMKDRIIGECYQINRALYVLTTDDENWEKLKTLVKKDF